MFDVARIWAPAPKDLASQLAPIAYNNQNSFTLTNANLTLFNAIPLDKMLLLSHVSGRINCGGAELVTQIRIYVADSQDVTTPLAVIFDTGEIAAGPATYQDTAGNPPNDLAVQMRVDIPVMPGQVVVHQLFKSGGVTNALFVTGLFGVLIPRGNWQR